MTCPTGVLLREVWGAGLPSGAAGRRRLEVLASRLRSRLAEIGINVNGDERAVPAGLSVAGLLEHLGLHPRMVVVERNGHILRRDGYDDAPVEPGDTFELVHFVGGG